MHNAKICAYSFIFPVVVWYQDTVKWRMGCSPLPEAHRFYSLKEVRMGISPYNKSRLSSDGWANDTQQKVANKLGCRLPCTLQESAFKTAGNKLAVVLGATKVCSKTQVILVHALSSN